MRLVVGCGHLAKYSFIKDGNLSDSQGSVVR